MPHFTYLLAFDRRGDFNLQPPLRIYFYMFDKNYGVVSIGNCHACIAELILPAHFP